MSLAHFVAICLASHNCITGVILGVQRDELLLDFFSSPLGTGSLSSVSNVTVFLSIFFSWKYTFLWALQGKLQSLLMFKTCLLASQSHDWVQYIVWYLQYVIVVGKDPVQENSKDKGKLVEFITLLHQKFLFLCPSVRRQIYFTVAGEDSEWHKHVFLLSMQVYLFWFNEPVLWRLCKDTNDSTLFQFKFLSL